MTNIETALTNLGEAAAVEIHKNNNNTGMEQLKSDVQKSGNVLNKAKTELEFELNKPIVTSKNYIDLTDNKDLIETK